MSEEPVNYHVILSGCSGGGKSSLLLELARRGFSTVEEPGRRIVERELRSSGQALPWVDLAAFAERAIIMARHDRKSVETAKQWIFFDRGLVDAAVALEHVTGIAVPETVCEDERFHRQVFMTPPWPEIYRKDDARRQGFETGIDEYHRLLDAYLGLDYEPVILPKTSVAARADLVLDLLGQQA